MPIDVKDVYQQAFEALRHASDYRAKIMGGWAAVLTAFAGIFVWGQDHRPDRFWIVAVAGLILNVMMWLADRRNRPALGRAKDIGMAIEEDASNGIKEERRFFSNLDRGVPHSFMIDIFGWLTRGMFIGAALSSLH